MSVILQRVACGIRSGQTFKYSLGGYLPGDLAVILPKNIIANRVVTPAFINRHEVPSLRNHLLREGEILVINKGEKFNTFLYQGDPPAAVATTAFYIITPGDLIRPEYLNWYLNQREAKAYLLANTKGST